MIVIPVTGKHHALELIKMNVYHNFVLGNAHYGVVYYMNTKPKAARGGDKYNGLSMKHLSIRE